MSNIVYRAVCLSAVHDIHHPMKRNLVHRAVCSSTVHYPIKNYVIVTTKSFRNCIDHLPYERKHPIPAHLFLHVILTTLAGSSYTYCRNSHNCGKCVSCRSQPSRARISGEISNQVQFQRSLA